MKKSSKKSNVCSIVRDCRVRQAKSLEEFSKRLGISYSHLCNIEIGKRDVPLKLVEKFCKILKYDEKKLLKTILEDRLLKAGLEYNVSVK